MEICCVEVNSALDATIFQGPEVVSLPADQLAKYPFKGSVLDAIPGDVKLSENDDVRRVQEEARALVRADALARAGRTVLSVPSISDIVRMNRVEGIAIGGGLARPLGSGFSGAGRVRFGTSDHPRSSESPLTAAQWNASEQQASTCRARRLQQRGRCAGDQWHPQHDRGPGVRRRDMTDDYRSRGFTLGLDAGEQFGARWRLAIDHNQQAPLAVHATPVTGTFQPAFPADSVTEWRATLSAYRAQAGGAFGSTITLGGSLSAARSHFDAASRDGAVAWTGRLVLRRADRASVCALTRLGLATNAVAVAGPNAPAQDLAWFGGPVTGPGYGYHEFSGVGGASQRVEWRHPVWSFPVPLGRLGSMRSPVSVAPVVQRCRWTRRHPLRPREPSHETAAIRGATGVAVRGGDCAAHGRAREILRDGRWTFSVDFSRDLWRIL